MTEAIYDTAAVATALDAMAEHIGRNGGEIFLIGIRRGGSSVADAIQRRLETAGIAVQRADLDISFYRDDLDTIAPHPEVHPSHIPFDVNGKSIWLVDDVLFTGRTIRAALGEIFDYGRPADIRLAVLVDRGGRELPIAADLAGLRHEAPSGMSVKVVFEDQEDAWRIEQRRVR